MALKHRWISGSLVLVLMLVGGLVWGANANAGGSNYFIPESIAQPIGQTITVVGVEDPDGSFLLYRQQLSWDAQSYAVEYAKFSRDPEGYLNGFIQALMKEWSKHEAEVSNWQISFITGYDLVGNRITYSTMVQCQVRGDKIILSWGGEHPTFAFEWLLMPLGFDLYAFKYAADSTLRWEGELDSTPTTIILNFPWPVSHCHYHVWHK